MLITTPRSRPLSITASALVLVGLAGIAQAQLSTHNPNSNQNKPAAGSHANAVNAETPPKTPLNNPKWVEIPITPASTPASATASTPAQQQQRNYIALPDNRVALSETSAHTPTPSDRRFRLFGEMPGVGVPGIHDHEPASPALTQITSTFDGADFDPQISRDGRFIVYASTQHRETSDIYLRHTHGSVITRVTSDPADDVMPALSPDGNRIAFTSNRSGNWDLYVMPASGGRTIQITSTPEHEIHPSWSPDGSRLVFSRFGQSSGRWEMWVTDVDNPSISRFIGYGLFPEWCPVPGTGYAGGDRILYQRSRERGDRAFTIWTLEYREGIAGNMSEIVASPTAALINPTWSPDGESVIYASMPLDDETTSPRQLAQVAAQPADLWMVGIEGNGRTSLTSGDSIDLMPTWGTDGRVYFVSNRGGRDNLWAIEVSEIIRTAGGAAPWSAQTPAPNTVIASQSNRSNSDPRTQIFGDPATADAGPNRPASGDPIAAFRQMPETRTNSNGTGIFANVPANDN